jgi:hypothetical protein
MPYHLGPFELGQIKAHLHHGVNPAEIARLVTNTDGEHFSETAIRNAVDKLHNDTSFAGEREDGSGAPRKTTAAMDRTILREVFKTRGKKKVTINYLKKKFPPLRLLSRFCVAERLHDAGLKKLRRRRKTLVGKKYLAPRISYCKWVLQRQKKRLARWAWTDGTTFFMDRDYEEKEQSERAALGRDVWKMADGSDSLFTDCVGPSEYTKAQGQPVKVWGLLAMGVLHIHILDKGENMNAELYAWLIDEKFEPWMGNCDELVCDFEKCLRGKVAKEALQRVGLSLVPGYPKVSQDFNAIENVWKMLRERLNEMIPKGSAVETRECFVARLKAAVKWLNHHREESLWYLSTNQAERCQQCLDLKGARTSW